MVKRMLDKYEGETLLLIIFQGKIGGILLRRHPEITLCTQQALEACRAKACTPEAIRNWYIDYKQFYSKII